MNFYYVYICGFEDVMTISFDVESVCAVLCEMYCRMQLNVDFTIRWGVEKFKAVK